MPTKVYSAGGFIVIEQVGQNLIPIAGFNYSFNTDTLVLIDEFTGNTFHDALVNIQDEAGTPVGDQAAIDAYLKGLVPTLELGGFADYNNTLPPYAIVANTWTDVTNDGAGAFSNKNFLPSGVTELMDVLTGYFDFTELTLGDTVLVRNDFQVTPNTNNALLELRYELGIGGGTYILEKRLDRLDSGSGTPYHFTLVPDLIYMGDDNTRLNPIKLQIRLSTGGTLQNFGSVIDVKKR